MIHSSTLNRGIVDKSHPTIKVPVSLHSNHETLLSTCVKKLWDDKMNEDDDFSFYLADGSGAKIDASLNVSGPRLSSSQDVEWTLHNYLKVSGCYPSRFCLYCVMQMTKPLKGNKSIAKKLLIALSKVIGLIIILLIPI